MFTPDSKPSTDVKPIYSSSCMPMQVVDKCTALLSLSELTNSSHLIIYSFLNMCVNTGGKLLNIITSVVSNTKILLMCF